MVVRSVGFTLFLPPYKLVVRMKRGSSVEERREHERGRTRKEIKSTQGPASLPGMGGMERMLAAKNANRMGQQLLCTI
jgi:hypothetical protein